LVDRLTPERRSWLMSRVGGKNTAPEIRVRRAAHAIGLRFRLHRRDLPGTPDLLFPYRRVALFVHGCFWHRHPGCPKASAPSSSFWAAKFLSNTARDARACADLTKLGWKVVVIWECETKDSQHLNKTVRKRVIGKRPKSGNARPFQKVYSANSAR
jgi:DNA mismatch endonuclease (patch repair protein)